MKKLISKVIDDRKQCCKCGNKNSNTILYRENEYICMDCYCELIAKDRKIKNEGGIKK